MSINSKSNYFESDPAILYDKEVSFRSEPNLRSEEIFKLHEGLKIDVKETINDWTLIDSQMAVKDGFLLHHLERLNKIIGIKIFNNRFT